MNNSWNHSSEEAEIIEELSEYFDVLGNETRIKILKILQKKQKDARTIATDLHDKWNIEVSIPNLKRHLKMLLEIGVITKYPVVRKEDNLLVMYYAMIPGSLDCVYNNLGVLGEYQSKNRTICVVETVDVVKLIHDLKTEIPSESKLALLDNDKILCEYPLEKRINHIGRTYSNHNNNIALPDMDLTIGRKHAIISYEIDKYYLVDIGSKNGTYIMDSQKQFIKLKPNTRIELNDGDIIRFGCLNTTVVFREGKF